MKLIVIICLCVPLFGNPLHPGLVEHWEHFKEVHQKTYQTHDHELLRRYIWENNVIRIQKHNMEADLGVHTYWLGVNEYSDWTEEEMKQRNGYRMDLKTEYQPSPLKLKKNAPTSKDWRSSGCVTAVKNQKQCGSCWAFSTTGSVEGQHCLVGMNKSLISLSEQNLVDCSRSEGNMGCGGGLMDQAFQYIIKNKGIDTEKCYPYEARNDQCRFKRSCVGATISGYHDIPTGDEQSLMQHLATIGPISVAIDASHFSFHQYSRGVYNEPLCSSTRLDHGVLAVGYGTEDGKDYWLVKNSWGGSWGLDGYIKMSRNKNNQCGIATSASYPVV